MLQPLRSVVFFAGSVLAVVGAGMAKEPISFSRNVLPILSDRCFHCHGPDEGNRKAELRLDQRDSATESYAIVPGDPDASELVARVKSDDPETRMPPGDMNRTPLSDREVRTLEQWIAQGAKWGRHWSFEKPQRPASPDPEAHPIDAFVQTQLHRVGLVPAEQASRETLIRRVSFDLTGLPPTVAEVDEYLTDTSADAYEKLVDRTLKSRHYGERMAMWWLDVARYADTDGFQQDATRTNWPWRDWVVSAFSQNMPFDQFTIEQFAGDLLPAATPEQKLATCFHRNHMTNGEGGRDPEESRIDYVLDRVNTTGSVWLGLTLGCCQCHAHKFDPISQEDYYSLFAFFNSIDEDGQAGNAAKPYLKYSSPHVLRAIKETKRVVERRAKVKAAVRAGTQGEFELWLAEQVSRVQDGFQPWHTLRAASLEAAEGSLLSQEADGTVQVSGPNPRQEEYRIVARAPISRVSGIRLEVMPHASHSRGKLSRGSSGEFILTDVKLQVRRQGQSLLRDVEIDSAIATAERKVEGRNYGNVKDTLDDDPRNGWTTEGHDPRKPYTAVFALAEPLQLDEDEELIFVMYHRSTRGDANIGRFRLAVTDQPGQAVRSLEPMPLEELAAAVRELDRHAAVFDRIESGRERLLPRQSLENTAPQERRPPKKKPLQVQHQTAIKQSLRERLHRQFLEDHEEFQQARRELGPAQRQLAELEKMSGELDVMVLAERTPARSTHVLQRGVWDQKGVEVSPAFPNAVLADSPDARPTRLDLAQWLVSRDNPLTARVIANQLWQICFGAGLVRTPDDFGLQGEQPTHPKLLDWLSVELMDHDWDIQYLLRSIVLSETYRQSSHMTPELLDRDPENRLLARAARFRLPSWMIRDAALRSSGLINPSLGGPPVMAYQPEGVWADMFMGRFRYEPSQGPAQYRRTIYTFWRRAAAPTFLFDSAQRRVCEVRVRRTNTPLHALTLLNDLSFLESARALSRTAIAKAGDPDSRIKFIFRSVLSRWPTAAEKAVLLRELKGGLSHYQANSADAKQFLQFGQPEKRAAHDPIELAAYTVVTSMVYNLDEAISHE